MYTVFIGGTPLPIAPEKISITIGNQNKTQTLIDGSEINILNPAALTEISFEALLPNVRYPFAQYERGFKKAEYYLKKFRSLKTGKKKFRLIICREKQGGGQLDDTNMTVSLESMSTTEQDADVFVSLSFKQYRAFGTRTAKIKKSSTSTIAERPGKDDSGKSHTVVAGDCLWNLTQQYLGDGNRYNEIYQKNKSVIDAKNRGTGNPRYTIYPGQVLHF